MSRLNTFEVTWHDLTSSCLSVMLYPCWAVASGPMAIAPRFDHVFRLAETPARSWVKIQRDWRNVSQCEDVALYSNPVGKVAEVRCSSGTFWTVFGRKHWFLWLPVMQHEILVVVQTKRTMDPPSTWGSLAGNYTSIGTGTQKRWEYWTADASKPFGTIIRMCWTSDIIEHR